MVSNMILSAAAWASSLRNSLVERLREESGQDLLEYAVLTGAIALVAAAALLGTGWLSFTDFKASIQNCVSFGASGPCP